MNQKTIVAGVRDVAFVLAIASITYGAWLIYHPMGFIVGGGVVSLGCVLHAMQAEES